MAFRSGNSPLPLTPLAFEILLALVDRDLHGYAILQAVEARLKGLLPLRTGTLYRALSRLLEEKLIEEIDAPPEDDERRRYYRLTAEGREVLASEADRLASQVDAARAKRLLPESRR